MGKIKIVNQQILSDKKFPLKYISFQKQDPRGEMRDQEIEVYLRPDAVSVLPADPVKEVFLLTRQFRMPTYLNDNESGYIVETCAGLIDRGETPEQPARREVEEESGCLINGLQKIAEVYIGCRNDSCCTYLLLISTVQVRTERVLASKVKVRTSNW